MYILSTYTHIYIYTERIYIYCVHMYIYICIYSACIGACV